MGPFCSISFLYCSATPLLQSKRIFAFALDQPPFPPHPPFATQEQEEQSENPQGAPERYLPPLHNLGGGEAFQLFSHALQTLLVPLRNRDKFSMTGIGDPLQEIRPGSSVFKFAEGKGRRKILSVFSQEFVCQMSLRLQSVGSFPS